MSFLAYQLATVLMSGDTVTTDCSNEIATAKLQADTYERLVPYKEEFIILQLHESYEAV